MKQNCWEYRKCGRETKDSQRTCPAVTEAKANRTNGGKNGGRVCWAIAGTCCDEGIQGTYAQKVLECWECGFRNKVQEEEGYRFTPVYFRSLPATPKGS